MTELSRAVDHYCERGGPAFDAEPVNALTNLAFFVAGYVAWRLYRRQPANVAAGGWLVPAIIVTIPVVGLGSMFFHTLAVRWAEWLDVIPILIFMLLYLWFAIRTLLGWPKWVTSIALLVFFIATFLLEAVVPGSFLWGGAMYLPTVGVLLGLGFAIMQSRPEASRSFLIAVGVFLASYTARTLDAPLCPVWGLGTHFIWHLLNALLLFLLARIAILQSQKTERAAA